jgi:hypothetical protein
MKKKLFFFLLTRDLQSTIQQKIERIINVQLNEEKSNPTRKCLTPIPFYCHIKFSKKLSGYIFIEKISLAEGTLLNLKILLMLDTSRSDHALIPKLSPITDQWQWQACLKINKNKEILTPEICRKIKPSLEDRALFTLEKLNFGKLFSLKFFSSLPLEKIENITLEITNGISSFDIYL